MNAQSTYRTFDRLTVGAEPITLRSRVPGAQSTFASYAVPLAKRHKLDKTGDPLSSQNVRWCMSQLQLDKATPPAPTPKVGDQIGDAGGGSFVIQSIAVKLFGNVFECEAFRQKGT